ncbi:MAG: hypothetical protein Q4C95_07485 [Planctomycetia bacterium]|nr:hypothetical protein [Planctomycetia bacterium]
MFPLHDRTRRFWTLFLFVLFGPGILFAVLGIIYARNGNQPIQKKESQLSQFFQLSFQIQKIDFIRPYEQRFQGLSLFNQDNAKPILFCPEVYVIHKNDSVTDSQIESYFEPETFSSIPHDFSTDNLKSVPSYEYWTIPKLYIQVSNLAVLQSNIFDQLTRISEKNNKIIFFNIEQIAFLFKEKEINALISNFEPLKINSAKIRKKNDDFFSKDQNYYSNIDISTETIQRWISDFDSSLQTFQLNQFRGLFIDLSTIRQLSASFHFDKIPMNEPIQFALLHQKAGQNSKNVDSQTFFMLNSQNVPFPCSFASLFSPIFQLTTRESWFSGLINATFESRTFLNNRINYSCELSNFHLFRCDVVPIAKRTTSIQINGTIADLYLKKALIKNGVFIGQGSLFLKNGSFERDLLLKLQNEFQLVFSPPNALSQSFLDNLVPFDEFAIEFEMLPNGVIFHSRYPDNNNIISIFKQKDFQYRLYLSNNLTPQPIPYQHLLTILGSANWSSFCRDAMNHLPTDSFPSFKIDENPLYSSPQINHSTIY